MPKASSTDSTKDRCAHSDEKPAKEQDSMGPSEDSEEQDNGGPSAVVPPSGISNTGPSHPSGPNEEEITSKAAPDGNLALQAEKVVAEKDQPNPSLSELANIMRQVLDVLQNSTIASKSGKDNRSRFWGVYKRVAEEHDGEFLERYSTDMDIVLIFSGLFSAVSTSFIVAMESNLNPDPSDTTNALLKQLVQIGLGNLAQAGSTPADPAFTWSPTAPTLWIQTIAYASLSLSLLAAFGAVLGKQWLGYYKSNRYGRGSEEERGKRRQEKFDGLVTWYFDAVVQSFPVLLQISLLLFGIALGANLWYEQPSIAWVIIATTVFGFLFYSLTVMASLISPVCPFQTPISTILRMLRTDRALRLVFKRVFSNFQQLMMSLHSMLQQLLGIVRLGWTRLSGVTRGPVYAVGDLEAHSLDLHLRVSSEDKYTLTFPGIPTSNLEALGIKWLLETSTDPEVFLAAVSLVPQVEWPLDIDISDTLHQLYDVLISCVGFHGKIIPSLEEKASACTMALSHLYCGRVLQAYPARGEFLGRRIRDYDTFCDMTRWWNIGTANKMVLVPAIQLCSSEDADADEDLDLGCLWLTFWSHECPDSILGWLSHSLPYHFVTGRVNENVENIATRVISKLLSSPSPPSNQIVANCTLLACVMIGVQFDKRDIVRIDKSSALPQLSEYLLAQFQKVLWAWDGGQLDKDSTGVVRRAWKLLGIICRIIELVRPHLFLSFHIMQNLDVCRRIYSRARSSEQNDVPVSLAALRKVLNFTFAAANISRDPTQLWDIGLILPGGSNSPEDFDWAVDYFDFIHSDDHEAAYDILLLLGSMEVRCSSSKQHLFFESLIACMDNNMPQHLRHAALRAAHNVRKEIVSIDAIDDAMLRDAVLTKLSPAILSVLCPHPDTTTTNDGPDHLFYEMRDFHYLELVFALAGNSDWRPHLSGDRHIDQCL